MQPDNKHTISILVDNEFGALARIINVFSSRGFNLDSLTVSEVDHKNELSRVTILTHGSEDTVKLIINLLERIVPVHRVRDLTVSSPHIEREVALVKVIGKEHHIDALQLAERFGARVVDSTPESFVFELSDTPEKIDKFIGLMFEYGVSEMSRTGVTAISKGEDIL